MSDSTMLAFAAENSGWNEEQQLGRKAAAQVWSLVNGRYECQVASTYDHGPSVNDAGFELSENVRRSFRADSLDDLLELTLREIKADRAIGYNGAACQAIRDAFYQIEDDQAAASAEPAEGAVDDDALAEDAAAQ